MIFWTVSAVDANSTPRLKVKQLYGRHHHLVDSFGIFTSQLAMDLLSIYSFPVQQQDFYQ